MGSVRAAYDSSTMLATIPAPVNTLGHSRVKPSVYFIPIDQPTSSRPATNNRTHAMTGTSVSELNGGASSLPARYGASRRGAPKGSKDKGKGLVTPVTSPCCPTVRGYRPVYRYSPVESSDPSNRSAATACRSRSRIST
ncbi:hypothetical protein GCM10010424_58900 [Streptomyces lienomycini]